MLKTEEANSATLFFVFFENNRSVVATKAERIAHGGIDFPFLWLVECEVKSGIQRFIIRKMIDRRRYDPIFYRQNGCNGFHCPGGAQQMPCHGFG